MKKITLIALLFAGTIANTYAQDNTPKPQTSKPCAKFYLGPSIGLNNESGLFGLNLDLPLDQVSIGAGFGMSTWGTKAYGEVKYFFKPCHTGWAVGLGITHNTGLSQAQMSMETTNSTPGKETVTLDTKGETNAFLAGYRFWNLGRSKHRVYLEFGWSVPFSAPQYNITTGQTLVPTNDKALKLMAPGGLIIGFGFSFGL